MRRCLRYFLLTFLPNILLYCAQCLSVFLSFPLYLSSHTHTPKHTNTSLCEMKDFQKTLSFNVLIQLDSGIPSLALFLSLFHMRGILHKLFSTLLYTLSHTHSHKRFLTPFSYQTFSCITLSPTISFKQAFSLSVSPLSLQITHAHTHSLSLPHFLTRRRNLLLSPVCLTLCPHSGFVTLPDLLHPSKAQKTFVTKKGPKRRQSQRKPRFFFKDFVLGIEKILNLEHLSQRQQKVNKSSLPSSSLCRG